MQLLRSNRSRVVALFIWGSVAATVLTLWLSFGRHLSPAVFADWVNGNLVLASLVYTLLLSVRGIFLVPSTPLLFAGIVVFPPTLVWILNMVGILTSSTIVYLLVRSFGFDYLARSKYQKTTRRLSHLMDEHGEKVIVGWSFFPAVPTDVIIYTAATVRLSLLRCLVAVAIGEGILITLYVATGQGLLELFGW